MPIVPIAIALTVLVVLLVAAIGPALRIARRRALGDEGEDLAPVPLDRERSAQRVSPRRFAPTPAGQAQAAGRVVSGRRAV
jgi:hypothetical protein